MNVENAMLLENKAGHAAEHNEGEIVAPPQPILPALLGGRST